MTLARDAFPLDRLRPIRRAEYDRMVRLGMFRQEKIELLYGRLVFMSPHGEPHAYSITRLTKLLVRALGDRADVRVQLPFAASDDSEPEPDVAIVPPGDYLHEHPRSALLVIEVADSSLQEDRRLKGALYAASGVPEYWIVNLVDRVIEVHRRPTDGTYEEVSRQAPGAMLIVPGAAEESVAVEAILPPAR